MNLSVKSLVKRFSALFVMAGAMIDMSAVPAAPYPINVPMPDGTTVTVRLHGDEYGSFVTSTDGYLLMRDSRGYYNYATLDRAGNAVATGVRAVDVERRSAADITMLRSIDRDAVVAARAGEVERMRGASPMLRNVPARMPGRATSATDISHHRDATSPTTPSTGKPHLLVVLVEFADKDFTVADPYATFNGLLNQEGYSDYNCTGSVRDYFIASSHGAYEPTFDLVGPVKVSKNSAYYAYEGNNGVRSTELVVELCELLDDRIDFSDYDTDGDGIVDNIYVFYAGYGQADTQDTSCIWPHSYKVYKPTYFDGVMLGNYTCSNELRGFSDYIAGIGTFCHEFSHALGLPDLYVTDYKHTHTPGQWSLMDQGSYNNDSRTPPLHSAYERWTLGWIAPGEIAPSAPGNVVLRPATTPDGYGDVQLIRTSRDNEFFLLENRQQQGWDRYIPGHGMLMWHIDFSAADWMYNRVNENADHPRVDIVEATGNIEHTSTAAAPFPGSSAVTAHTVTDWNGRKVGVDIDGVYESEGGNIYFDINGGNPVKADRTILNAPVVDANRVTLSWSPVAGVEYYIIDIYGADDNIVSTDRVYGNSFETVLTEGTPYYCKLTWMSGTDCTFCDTQFTTGYLPISEHCVEALEPVAVGDNTVTAAWLPLVLAGSYTVEIAACEGVEGKTLTEDFTDRQLHNDGWATSGTAWNASRYGTAAPAVTLKEGTYLTVPAWDRPIDELRFFGCSSSTMTLSSLIVDAADASGAWREVYRERTKPYSSRDKESLVITLGKDKLGDDAMSVRFTLEGTVNWAVIDDISVIYAETYSYHDAGISPVNAGSCTSVEISGLEPGTTYAYRIIGKDGEGLDSEPSEWIVFTTTGSSGIGDIVADTDDENLPWYTVTGLRLDSRPSVPGLYIHSRRVVRIP